MTKVACNGCTACCRHELVALFPEHGDDVCSYDHTEVRLPSGDAFQVLRQRADGTCIYLGSDGCTIYARAPAVCQRFDCRKYFLSMTRSDRRTIERQAPGKFAVFQAARKRIDTLDPAEVKDAINRRIGQVPIDQRKYLSDLVGDKS